MQKPYRPTVPKKKDPTFLIIQEDAEKREQLGSILKNRYRILYASNGRDAMRLIHENKEILSLILFDLSISDTNGPEMLVALKNDPDVGLIPVIALTSEEKEEAEVLRLGAMDFIPMPYPAQEVIFARVRRIANYYEYWDTLRRTEYDRITGLFKRDYFYRYCREFDLHDKELSSDAVVININNFHILNEQYGKTMGDKMLRHLANELKDVVSEEGLVCRREADTFLVYCRHRTDYNAVLDAVSTELTRKLNLDRRIRLRMGVYPEADKDLDIQLRFDRAKLAADTMRGSFGKTIAFFDNSLHELEIFENNLLNGFRDAIENEQFTVYYQPKFDIRPETPHLSSAEALVRWNHPQMGALPPDVFVPLFEDHGLIQELDQFVWRRVAAQQREWKERLHFTVPISVNVSRTDMYDTGLISYLEDMLKEFGLSGEDLLLEITESAYTQDSEQIIDTVHKMRKLGLRVEMDDFGAGYSSLNMISSLPIDVLKLDLEFIRNAFGGRKNTRMLEVILDIADTLQVPTVAEGVETAEQMMTLRSMGCDYVQGFYFSKPIPPEEFEAFLLERKALGDIEEQAHRSREKMRASREEEFIKMTYDSLHDPLTGLYNHTAYELLFKDMDQNNIAMMIGVVDGFKFISDRYGKDVADEAICRIAEILKRSFRSVDYIFRISKDEFAIILTRIKSEQQDIVSRKLEQINAELGQPQGEVPPLSLCIGVAFGDRKEPQGDIFRDADLALRMLREANEKGFRIF